MNAPHVIHPNAVYDREAVVITLGFPKTILLREIGLGRLRCAKRAGKYFILGQWLLDWIEAAELKSEQQEFSFRLYEPSDTCSPTRLSEDPIVESQRTESLDAETAPHIEPACARLTTAQHQQLTDGETQEKYRTEYIRQLRQRSCPGCGEGEQLF
jgi:hypothetical protein